MGNPGVPGPRPPPYGPPPPMQIPGPRPPPPHMHPQLMQPGMQDHGGPPPGVYGSPGDLPFIICNHCTFKGRRHQGNLCCDGGICPFGS